MFYFGNSNTYAQPLMEKYYFPLGTRGPWPGDIITTSDGGLLLLSRSQEGTNGCTESGSLYLFKMDNQGIVQWQNRLSYQRGLEGAKVYEDNGFYYILAYVWFGIGGPGEVFIKIDNAGSIIWSKKFSNASANSSLRTSSNNLLLIGDNITTIDFNGNILSSFQYARSGTALTFKIAHEAENGNILLCSERQFPDQNCLIKIDPAGNVIWSKAIDSVNVTNINFHSNTIYLVGTRDLYSSFIANYDNAGNYVSSNSYTNGTGSYIDGVEFRNNGNLITYGFACNFEEDSGGNILRSDIYLNDLQHISHRTIEKIILQSDGSIISLYRYQNDSLGCHTIGFSVTDGGNLTNCRIAQNQIYKSPLIVNDSIVVINSSAQTVIDSSIIVTNVGAQGQILPICMPVNVEDDTNYDALIIFPNPSTSKIKVSLKNGIRQGC